MTRRGEDARDVNPSAGDVALRRDRPLRLLASESDGGQRMDRTSPRVTLLSLLRPLMVSYSTEGGAMTGESAKVVVLKVAPAVIVVGGISV